MIIVNRCGPLLLIDCHPLHHLVMKGNGTKERDDLLEFV